MTRIDPRSFYRIAVVVPLTGLAVAAWLGRGASLSPELPIGWDWLYPSSLMRALLAYALVAVWLWQEVGRRSGSELRRIIRIAPLVYVAVLWAILLLPALARGRAGALWSEQSGTILLRTAVHLLIGYACVVLLEMVRRFLEESEGSG